MTNDDGWLIPIGRTDEERDLDLDMDLDLGLDLDLDSYCRGVGLWRIQFGKFPSCCTKSTVHEGSAAEVLASVVNLNHERSVLNH